MCLKYLTRSWVWNCPLNPHFPRHFRTTWDRSGAVATRIRASDQVAPPHLMYFARQRWTCVLVVDPEMSTSNKFNLMSVGRTQKVKHILLYQDLPRTSCSTFFPVDVCFYMPVCRTCCLGTAGRGWPEQAFWVCLRMEYALPPTWQS